MFSEKEFAVVSDLRFISRTNFMLSRVEHEKKFYNFRARFYILYSDPSVRILRVSNTNLVMYQKGGN